MRTLRYTASARDDLADIAVYIATSGSRAAAEAFIRKLEDRCERLASLPGILGQGRPELRVDIRSIPHQGCMIFFRYGEASVKIVNVLGAARDGEHVVG